MSQPTTAEHDLAFVRRALDASLRQSSPAALYFLWAAIALVGFFLNDVRPLAAPVFWNVAAPLGFVASVWLGMRHARHRGQRSTADGKRHLLHWLAVLVAVALLILLHVGQVLPQQALTPVILIVVALGYVSAGVYLDRSFFAVGLFMAAGAVLVPILDVAAWTIVGVLIAATLVRAGLREGRTGGAAQ